MGTTKQGTYRQQWGSPGNISDTSVRFVTIPTKHTVEFFTGSDGEPTVLLGKRRADTFKKTEALEKREKILGQWACVPVTDGLKKQDRLWYTYTDKIGGGLTQLVWVVPPMKRVSSTEVGEKAEVVEWEEIGEWSAEEKSRIKKGEERVRGVVVERFRDKDEVANFVRTTDPHTRIHASTIPCGWGGADNLFMLNELKAGMGKSFVERDWMKPNSAAQNRLKAMCGISHEKNNDEKGSDGGESDDADGLDGADSV